MSNSNFINKLKKDLQEKFFKYDDIGMNILYDFFKKYDVYLVGKYITNLYLDYDNNNGIDIFISNKNIEDFLLNFFSDFSIIEQQFITKYSTIYDNILQLYYIFKNGNNDNKFINVYIYQEEDGEIVDILKKYSNISLFKVWWNFDKNIKLFDKDKKHKINDKYYDDFNNNGVTKKEYDFYISKGIEIEKPNKLEKPELNYKDIEKEIIKTALIELTFYNFVNEDKFKIMQERTISSVINKKIYELLYICIFNSDFIKPPNLYDNIDEFYRYALNTILIGKLKEFTYKEFIKAINEIYNPKIDNYKIKKYLDMIIRQKFLNKYNIKINTNNRKIKFEINDTSKSLMTKEEENHIKQVLLFYYKNRIFNFKENYKFLNNVVNTFKLLDLNCNLIIDEKNKIFNKLLVSISKSIMSIFMKRKKSNDKLYHKILKHNNELNYDDLILNENIENVKDFLNEDDDNILLCDSSRKNITCISKNSLDELIYDYNDNWFYDCSKFKNEEYLLQPYIKITTTTETYYIPYQYVYSLFKSNNKLFYINKTDEIIKKTSSYKNTPRGQQEGISRYVGANHCQDGSNIQISIISTIKEQKEKIIKTNISLNKTISISSSSRKDI